MAELKEPQSYQDLTNLAIALSTGANARLMSLEEARAIWKKYLAIVGLRQSQPSKKTVKKAEKPATSSKKKS